LRERKNLKEKVNEIPLGSVGAKISQKTKKETSGGKKRWSRLPSEKETSGKIRGKRPARNASSL